MPAPPVAKMISNYAELISACRQRADDLELTRAEIDYQSGLHSGYSAKILSLSQTKRLGPVSLDAILGTLGCRLLLIEDEAQTAKILARRTPRQRPLRAAHESVPHAKPA